MEFNEYVIQGVIERLAREYNRAVSIWNDAQSEPENHKAYVSVVMTFEKPDKAFTDIL